MAGKCPFQSDLLELEPEPEEPYYTDYLGLKSILNSQKLLSEATDKPVHDEMFFIIIHQVYELWFKQILFEIDSIQTIFKSDTVDEKNTLKVVQRLTRVLMILKLVTDQMPILETMTAQDFLAFRDLLAPASGFQSWQFRKIEAKLGLRSTDRLGKSAVKLQEALKQEDRDKVHQTENELSLVQLIQNWLERTPGLEEDNYSFFDAYKKAFRNTVDSQNEIIEQETNQKKKEQLIASVTASEDTFQDIFDVAAYNKAYRAGQRRMTHKSIMGALMIYVYRDFPRFSQPFQILTLLTDVDNQLTKWRYAHCQMAQRMIGSRIGTGNSSGYHYLRSTMSDHYKVFVEISGLSTYLIHENFVPSLPEEIKKKLTGSF